jgi:hypothetical protein
MALEEIAPIKNQYIPTNFVVVESFGNINEWPIDKAQQKIKQLFFRTKV